MVNIKHLEIEFEYMDNNSLAYMAKFLQNNSNSALHLFIPSMIHSTQE